MSSPADPAISRLNSFGSLHDEQVATTRRPQGQVKVRVPLLQDAPSSSFRPPEPSLTATCKDRDGHLLGASVSLADVENVPIDTSPCESTGACLGDGSAIQGSGWDFALPTVPSSGPLEEDEEFDISNLIGAMQHGASSKQIRRYMSTYDSATILRDINKSVKRIPPIFFASATNDEDIIRTFIRFGANVNAVHESSGVPLIAFIVIYSEIIQSDTSKALVTLLSFGANSHVISMSFYKPLLRDFSIDDPEDSSDVPWEEHNWCKGLARSKLIQNLNLTQRYAIDRASNLKKPSLRQTQIVRARDAEALLRVPFYLIGQVPAVNLLLRKLLAYLTFPPGKPLVLVFAGPSGHGKTELATRLGHLLSLELEVVDCTIYTYESDLFGARAHYQGSQNGSPLNDFLVRNSGKRCVVFLDEFEKMNPRIHQTLLYPFDNGNLSRFCSSCSLHCAREVPESTRFNYY